MTINVNKDVLKKILQGVGVLILSVLAGLATLYITAGLAYWGLLLSI